MGSRADALIKKGLPFSRMGERLLTALRRQEFPYLDVLSKDKDLMGACVFGHVRQCRLPSARGL
ncbi:MAG: hypothetical protein JWR22_1869 [Herminiimonas sp.]|nr:hypothetical protein [Herminiimonas sp.]